MNLKSFEVSSNAWDEVIKKHYMKIKFAYPKYSSKVSNHKMLFSMENVKMLLTEKDANKMVINSRSSS